MANGYLVDIRNHRRCGGCGVKFGKIYGLDVYQHEQIRFAYATCKDCTKVLKKEPERIRMAIQKLLQGNEQ